MFIRSIDMTRGDETKKKRIVQDCYKYRYRTDKTVTAVDAKGYLNFYN